MEMTFIIIVFLLICIGHHISFEKAMTDYMIKQAYGTVDKVRERNKELEKRIKELEEKGDI